MIKEDNSYFKGWKLTEEGPLQIIYRWIKNPNIEITFTDDGVGTTFIVTYNKTPLGYLARSNEDVQIIIRELLPMIDSELNWFISKFRNLLSELSDRISNNYALIDAIVTSEKLSNEDE